MRIPTPRQLESGNWFIQLRLGGKSISKAFPTEDEALRWAQSYKEAFKKAHKKTQYEALLLGIAKEQENIPDANKKDLPTIARELELINTMDGNTFEEYCKNLLLLSGCFNGGNILITKRACDYGADLIVECLNGTRVSVQCKRLNAPVRIDAIQEVVSSKQHYMTTVAAVMTNSTFTKQAKILARDNGVALIGRNELIKLIQMKIDALDKIYNQNQWEVFLKTLDIVKVKGNYR